MITSYQDFTRHYVPDAINPVVADLLMDLDTPVSVFLKTTRGPYRFLLESVESGTQRSRHSIIGDTPIAIFKSKRKKSIFIDITNETSTEYTDNPLDVLQQILSSWKHPGYENIPFYNGGFYGYLGYDTVRFIEKIPETVEDDTELDDIHMFVPQRVIVFDNLLNKISIIYFSLPQGDTKAEYDSARGALTEMIKDIHFKILQQFRISQSDAEKDKPYESNLEPHIFKQMVERAKDYITKGDIFQVVLSQRLQVDTPAVPFDIYRALRSINPSPYMFYMELENLKLLGASPETLVKLENKKVLVKPIAGTRRRGQNDAEDRELIEDLLADPKERAEHTMLVDLGRNDIGRIATFGSVRVDDLMTIEKYSHVIHIVSTVSGTLRENMDAVDVFKSSFPAGTVSGAPKVRAMEIIDELEPTRRGVYAGAVGYFSFDGNMDVCIAIRTIYIKNGTAFIQAGAGIVADSVPSREYEETLNKARGLLKAIAHAEGGFI